MAISKQTVADKIAAYLHHEISIDQLVDWSERTLMEAELEDLDAALLAHVLARLGLADVKEFGLAWEDCESLLRQLGFAPQIQLVAV